MMEVVVCVLGEGELPELTGVQVPFIENTCMKLIFSCLQSSLKGLEAGGLRVVSITDVTPIPHNGCRPRKARRL